MMWIRHINLSMILIGVAFVILPTFTPEDLITTLPIIALLPHVIVVNLMAFGILLLLAGLILRMRGL